MTAVYSISESKRGHSLSDGIYCHRQKNTQGSQVHKQLVMIPNSHVFESLITFSNVTVLHLLLEWNKGPVVGGGGCFCYVKSYRV